MTIFQTLQGRLSCPPSLTGSTLFPTLMAHKMWNKREIEGEREEDGPGRRRLCAWGVGSRLGPGTADYVFLPSFLPSSPTLLLPYCTAQGIRFVRGRGY